MDRLKFRSWNRLGMTYFTFKEISEWDSAVDGRGKCVWPEGTVIMQYSGLKDKNGKEIYEGDVMQFTLDNNDTDHHSVKFIDGRFVIGSHNLESLKDELDYWGDNIFVIGNIYENKDLLL